MTAPRAALAALIGLKLALLLWIGPLTSPDIGGYTAIAKAMCSGVYWGPLDLSDPEAAGITARAPGFPALLALAGRLAGASADWLVALAQIGLGIAAAAALYRFALTLLDNRLAALLVAAAYATGLPLVLDQTLLTDGAYASLIVLFLSLMGTVAASHARVDYAVVLLIGMLPAAGLLLRESTSQAMVALLPAVACFAWAARAGLPSRLAVIAALIVPLAATGATVSAFNAWRTGTPFYTSGLRTALLVPLVQMQARGVPVFAADDPVVRVLAEEIGEWRNEAIYAAVPRAERRLGMTAMAMSDAVRALFLQSVSAHPGAYAALVVAELRPRYFALSVVPAASLGTLVASRAGELVSVAQSIPEGGVPRFFVLGAYGATAVIAAVAWLAMAAGLPALALWRARGGIDRRLTLLLALAAAHLGFFLLYAMVHIEARYLAAVQFIPPLALAYLILEWRRLK
jgi:hypothetical protein